MQAQSKPQFLSQLISQLSLQVRALPVQQVSLAQAVGRVEPNHPQRLSPLGIASRTARGESSVSCVSLPRVGLLPAEQADAATSIMAASRFLQAALQARGGSPTAWPATAFPGSLFDSALGSLQEGFDVVIAVLPPNAMRRLPAERASAEHWTWSLRDGERGRVILHEQNQQWTIKVEADPLSMLSAWHLAIAPLLNLLEGLPAMPAEIRPANELITLGEAQHQAGKLCLAELGWLKVNEVNLRRLAQLLDHPDWDTLPAQLGLIEMQEGQGVRLLWQAGEAADG